jgi:hypothetical protein
LETRALLSGITVINLADAGPGSLRDAVELANATPGPDTIDFAAGLSGTIALTEQIEITDDLKIDGPGADEIEISGEEVTRVFLIGPEVVLDNPFQFVTVGDLDETPAVKIEGLSINNGFATDTVGFPPPGDPLLNPGFAFGGGVLNVGSTVNLTNVSMSGNTAEGVLAAGGAVGNELGGILTVVNSQFSDNLANGFFASAGGAITSDLGPRVDDSGAPADPTNPPEVVIRSSTFIGNQTATLSGDVPTEAFSGSSNGGAILNLTGTLTVSNSKFIGNQSTSGEADVVAPPTAGGLAIGGAINTSNVSPFGFAQAELIVSNSTFLENGVVGGNSTTAGVAGGLGRGGAISVNNGATARLHGNRFRANFATGGQAGPDAVGGIGDGGAVSASGGSNITSIRNVFHGNRASGGDGAVAGEGNGAYGRGGAISNSGAVKNGLLPGPATVNSQRDRIIGNTAVGGIGGGIYNEGAMSVKHGRVANNRAIGAPDATNEFLAGYVFRGSGLAGGISNNEGALEIYSSRITGNQAIGSDGVVGTNLSEDPSVLAILPGVGNGGGISNVGGGVHNPGNPVVSAEDAGSMIIADSLISRNRALGGDEGVGSFAGIAIGGGIYNDATMSIIDATVRGNRAIAGDGGIADFNPGTAFGGGIASGTFSAAVTERTAELTIRKSDFAGNRSIGGEDVTSLLGEDAPVAQRGGTGFGGGIHVYEGTADISKSRVRGNRAIGGDGAAAAGGIFIFGYIPSALGLPTTGNISQTVVTHNRAIGGTGADAFGGGITVGSFGSIFSLIEPGNFESGTFGANAELTRVAARSNQAIGGRGGDGLGGGIYSATDSTVDAALVSIYRNKARGGVGGNGLGGGIYNAAGSEMDLTLALIYGNRAQRGPGGQGIGGGIYNAGDLDETLTLVFANWASDSDDNCFGC